MFKLIKDKYEKIKKAWGKRITIFIILSPFLTLSFFIFLILDFFFIELFTYTIFLTFFFLFLTILLSFIGILICFINGQFFSMTNFVRQFSNINLESSHYKIYKFKKYANYGNYALKNLVKFSVFTSIASIIITIVMNPFKPNILQSLWLLIPFGLLISVFMNYFATLFLKQKIVFNKLHNTMKSFLVILIEKYSTETEDYEIAPLKNDYELMVLFIEYMNFCFRKIDEKEIANQGEVFLKFSKIEKSKSLDKFSILIDTYENPLKTISTFDISLEKQKIRSATLVGWIMGIISSLYIIVSLIIMLLTSILQ